MTSKKVCAELLRKELETPIKSQKQVWHLLERLATCFVSVSDEVYQIGLELYGNGTPGGMKIALREIEMKQEVLQQSFDEIKHALALDGSVDRRKPDTFDSMLKWFADKVLPTLVIGFLMGVGNLMLFLAFIFFAYTNGLLVIP